MTQGLETTLRILARTANEAAVPTLLAALDSPDEQVREGALRALLDRRSQAGQRELLRRWDQLGQAWKRTIAQHPARLSSAVRDAILGTDKRLCVNGCDAVLWIREYDLIPALIHAVGERQHVYADLAAHTLLSLTELLYRDTRQNEQERDRRDPARLRLHVVGSLEQAVERFDQHKRREVVEAFLLLADCGNQFLQRLLRTPRDAAYLVMLDVLNHSSREGVLRLLYEFLDDPHAPHSVLNVVAHRADMGFLKRLLKHVGPTPSGTVRGNFRRIDNLTWAQGPLTQLESLNDDEQSALVQLVVASGMNRLQAFEVLRQVLQRGNVGGRRAASAALADFGGADANRLTMEGLSDSDPQVQANMVRQLRHRGIPGAITRLVESIESPHAEVQMAARESLTEFNFKRFISAFDMLEEEVRKSTGMLVRRIDPQAINQLAEELKSATRTRKFRALDAAIAMSAVADIEPLVLNLMGNTDHFLRAAAARALGHCDTPLSRQALREALLDPSATVQEEAEAAIRNLIGGETGEDLSGRLTHLFRQAERILPPDNAPFPPLQTSNQPPADPGPPPVGDWSLPTQPPSHS